MCRKNACPFGVIIIVGSRENAVVDSAYSVNIFTTFILTVKTILQLKNRLILLGFCVKFDRDYILAEEMWCFVMAAGILNEVNLVFDVFEIQLWVN